MKKFKVTMTMTVSDEYFENEVMEMKNAIFSGKMQREIVDESKNGSITKCIATFEELKTELELKN